MRNRALGYAVLSLWLGLLAACAQLPEYAKPRTIQIDDLKKVPTAFTYRPLKPEDFRATSLPAHMSEHGEKIRAQSATTIRITADSKFSIKPWPFLGQIKYLGSINHIAFEAVMIPENSWWNPNLRGNMTAYVLQHEQIHFALTESAARKLTRDAREWAANLTVVKDTPQEVYAEVFQQIKGMIKSAMEANQKRHLNFDQDTSLSYSPVWQAWWLETVEKELKQSASEIKAP